MNDPGLKLSDEGAVAHLRLMRGALHNRFDEALHTLLADALAPLAGRDDLAALVISAEGRSFSAGGDFELMLRLNGSAELRERMRAEGLAIVERLLAIPYPVIAAVQGAAVGLGATLVAACDVQFAWREARIADPHVVLGLVAGDGGVLAWAQSVGLTRAKRHLLTGDPLTAEQAHAIGLISDLVERPEDALPAAMALARRFAAMPRAGVRGTKRAFAKLSRELYGPAFEQSLDDEVASMADDELRDTVRAAIAARRLQNP
ncbi:MAG TPA: enoyl-CoA hydratase/isomerase family protein [Novosphingobium sp.]|nr:enoyl-CoA hydratase/isomerase family protein [Novosphingobium sp.]